MLAWNVLWHIGIATSGAMLILWLIQLKTSDAGIVDVGWSFGLAATAFYLAIVGEGDLVRRIVVALLVGVWALRLGLYLLFNRILGEHRKEDGRYQRMRESLGQWAGLGFFAFFQVQALFVVLFALPLLVPFANPNPMGTIYDWLGILVWLAAVGGEGLADHQLARFRENPENRGKTCQVGLWRYSRHPNYFFEWVHWFAYIFFSVGTPYFWMVCLAPLVMIFFLLKVTGVPFTEQQALANRPDYAEYQKTTPMFFPWFPKR